jgi:4,5-DOPA dioxygenase extradiol
MERFNDFVSGLNRTHKMPVLFLGHGSPMNAIEENEFVSGFRQAASALPKPAAILCVSAHWETRGTWVTAMEHPATIHDFGGFPEALYQVQYPAPGSPELAAETAALVQQASIGLDDKWGLDHGAWSVIRHMYPDADVPVVQMSLDRYRSPESHFELASELYALRKRGVLIIGSGNMVHNLRMVAWDKLNEPGFGYDWAVEASERMKKYLFDDDPAPLIGFAKQGKAFQLAIPTPEHYLPLLYALALRDTGEELSLFNDKHLGGSLTMTSFRIG